MKIAVVGGGISGLSCAYFLSAKYEVSLFEAGDYIGGHTDTHQLELAGRDYRVDSGFIVFNEANYPNFSRLLSELGVPSQDSDMSFSVSNQTSGLEYNATNLNSLFCQRRNLLNPRFYRMLKDLVRFYREAPEVLEYDSQLTLKQYLDQNNYSQAFIEDHIIPMACALWSGPRSSIVDFPIRYFVSFMHNHKMLQLSGRPQWRVVKGGSRSYIDALLSQQQFAWHTNAAVNNIERDEHGVRLQIGDKVQHFDKVFIATHSDTALNMLATPSLQERQILGDISYQQNHMALHTDTSILPDNPKAWASWNARISDDSEQQCTVSYYMNLLQSIDGPEHFIVSLNSKAHIDPDKILLERQYAHPVYNHKTLAAQTRWSEIGGQQHSYYCGAYWGWGFHEDGISSALRAVQHFDSELGWPQDRRHVA